MYVNPEAHEAAIPGQPLPDGTVLIMEDHKAELGAADQPVTDANGRLIPTDEVTNVFVMEKQPGWGAAYLRLSQPARQTPARRRRRPGPVGFTGWCSPWADG